MVIQNFVRQEVAKFSEQYFMGSVRKPIRVGFWKFEPKRGGTVSAVNMS